MTGEEEGSERRRELPVLFRQSQSLTPAMLESRGFVARTGPCSTSFPESGDTRPEDWVIGQRDVQGSRGGQGLRITRMA